jgi:GDP-4-dehydro-6-deoxy-D-mannose reductase
MSTILVTGLSGFVGSWIAGRGEVADLLLAGKPVDLRNAGEVKAAVAAIRPAAVIHLAAQSSVASSFDDAAATYRVNFDGTFNLLRALAACGFAGRMLYVGSGDVYGSVAPERLPVVEEMPLRPRNPYGVSKVAAETLCYQWSQTGPFEIVMARPFNHVGARQSTVFAVADFARQIVAHRHGRGSGVLQVGDIDTTRDFTDVRDVVDAYLQLLVGGRNGEAYNVCSGIERSLRDVLEGLFAAADVRMPVQVMPERLRAAEQRRMRGSYRKLQADTGWQPRVPFAQTLADIVAYWEGKEQS